jgi:hypothetical protein
MLGRNGELALLDGTDQGATSGSPPLAGVKLQCQRNSNVRDPEAALAMTAYLLVERYALAVEKLSFAGRVVDTVSTLALDHEPFVMVRFFAGTLAESSPEGVVGRTAFASGR